MFALKQEGQGLGKQEQGISMALQVEKTSKRGGRIISEKEIMPPPPLTAPGANSPGSTSQQQSLATQLKPEPTITEIMRSPSKVVLLRVSYMKRDLFLHNFHSGCHWRLQKQLKQCWLCTSIYSFCQENSETFLLCLIY